MGVEENGAQSLPVYPEDRVRITLNIAQGRPRLQQTANVKPAIKSRATARTGAGQARRRRRGSGAAAATAKSIPILLSSSFIYTKTRCRRRRAILGQHTYQCVVPADAVSRLWWRRRPAISHQPVTAVLPSRDGETEVVWTRPGDCSVGQPWTVRVGGEGLVEEKGLSGKMRVGANWEGGVKSQLNGLFSVFLNLFCDTTLEMTSRVGSSTATSLSQVWRNFSKLNELEFKLKSYSVGHHQLQDHRYQSQ